MGSLAETLPTEISRVREIQDQFKELRAMPNTIVEPQIAMMEADISSAISATAQGDVVEMLRAYKRLKQWG